MSLTVNQDYESSSLSLPANSKTIGERSEALVLARFLQVGWVVLQPFGDNQRYDLVVDRGNGFERVQVKTGRLKNGVIWFEPCSTYAHRGGKRKSYLGQIELFAIYCPETAKVYLCPVEEFRQSGRLRISKTKNGQAKAVRWANEFEI